MTDPLAQVSYYVHATTSRDANLEDPNVPLEDYDKTPPGVVVNHDTALQYAPVWQAVNVIAGDVAQLPLIVYRRLPNDGRERAVDHPGYRLLRRRPNPEMTPYVFKEILTAQALTWGNGYAEIKYDTQTGLPESLWPLDASRMTPVRENGVLHYEWENERGVPVPIEHLPMRPGETPGAVVSADTSTLELVDLDVSQLVPLDEGVDRTIDWFEMVEGATWNRV